MKLLDSDHCVGDILRGRLDLGDRVAVDEELAVSAISVGELVHGAYKSLHASDNLARLDVLLSMLVSLPNDEAAARRFGQLKARLERIGEIGAIPTCRSPALLWSMRPHWSRITWRTSNVLPMMGCSCKTGWHEARDA